MVTKLRCQVTRSIATGNRLTKCTALVGEPLPRGRGLTCHRTGIGQAFGTRRFYVTSLYVTLRYRNKRRRWRSRPALAGVAVRAEGTVRSSGLHTKGAPWRLLGPPSASSSRRSTRVATPLRTGFGKESRALPELPRPEPSHP